MKRNNALAGLLLADTVLLPVIVLVSGALGYTLRVGGGMVYGAINTAVYLTAGLCMLVSREKRIGRAQAILISAAPLLNQINTLFALFKDISTPAICCMALWLVPTVMIVAAYVKSIWLKITFYTLSGLLVLPICLCILLSDFGSTTVIASEVSPDGAYCAEVLDDDQGALGGATILKVYKYDESFSIGSFAFRKDERVIFRGAWGIFASLRWEDDDHVTMNGSTYTMSYFFLKEKVSKRTFQPLENAAISRLHTR